MNWHWVIRLGVLAAAGVLAWIVAGLVTGAVLQGVTRLTAAIQGWLDSPQDLLRSLIHLALWLVILTLAAKVILRRRG